MNKYQVITIYGTMYICEGEDMVDAIETSSLNYDDIIAAMLVSRGE